LTDSILALAAPARDPEWQGAPAARTEGREPVRNHPNARVAGAAHRRRTFWVCGRPAGLTSYRCSGTIGARCQAGPQANLSLSERTGLRRLTSRYEPASAPFSSVPAWALHTVRATIVRRCAERAARGVVSVMVGREIRWYAHTLNTKERILSRLEI
jgi:hypothetical protein